MKRLYRSTQYKSQTGTLGCFNSLRPRQNGGHFADDIFEIIFLNENVLIPIKMSLKFVPKSPINNIPALLPIMAWRRPGGKPLSETMMVGLPTHICVTRPQWVNYINRRWFHHSVCPWTDEGDNAKPWCMQVNGSHFSHGPLARYLKLRVAHAPEMPGTFSPPSRVSDPDMHHGTCVTHVPWCMPGSLNSGFLCSRWRGKCPQHSRRMLNP